MRVVQIAGYASDGKGVSDKFIRCMYTKLTHNESVFAPLERPL